MSYKDLVVFPSYLNPLASIRLLAWKVYSTFYSNLKQKRRKYHRVGDWAIWVLNNYYLLDLKDTGKLNYVQMVIFSGLVVSEWITQHMAYYITCYIVGHEATFFSATISLNFSYNILACLRFRVTETQKSHIFLWGVNNFIYHVCDLIHSHIHTVSSVTSGRHISVAPWFGFLFVSQDLIDMINSCSLKNVFWGPCFLLAYNIHHCTKSEVFN